MRQQLFFYRDLWVWLDDPFQAPPALAGVHDNAQQLEITWYGNWTAGDCCKETTLISGGKWPSN
jgi:hypothetical protein